MSHTPGPWEFGRNRDGLRMILGGPGRRYVGEVQVHQFPRAAGLLDEGEREANAVLLLAAVEMLGALYAVKHAFEGVRDKSDEAAINDAYKRACWAIAKAEGRTSQETKE